MDERAIDLGAMRLSVLEAGAGGRPFLAVHGFGGAKEDFADHLDAFARRGWHAVAPDLRGHGSSSAPASEEAYSFDAFAADLAALVDALGWGSPVVLGHSMGGMIVQRAVLADPRFASALILMDTTHRRVKLDPGVAEIGAALARDGGMAAVKAALDELGEDAPLGSEAFDRVCRERPGYQEFCDAKLLATSPAMYAVMLEALAGADDVLPALASLAHPTLVLVGDQDEPFLGASHRMAASMPNAELAVIEGAGHSPQFEAPERWWATVSAFLDGLTGA